MTRLLLIATAGLVLTVALQGLLRGDLTPEQTQQAQALIAEIEGKDWQKREKAIETLAKVVREKRGGDMSEFVPAVEPLMGQVGWGGLGRRTSELAADTIAGIGEAGVPTLLANLKGVEARRRWMAVEILTWIGPGRASVPGAIVPMLEDKDAYVRRTAAECLGKLGDLSGEAEGALEKATKDEDATVAIAAYRSLVEITGKGEPYVGGLAGYLKDANKDVRAESAAELGNCGSLARTTWPELMGGLKDPEANVRIESATALGKIGVDEEGVIDALIERLKNDKEPYVQGAAALSLGEMGPKAKRAAPLLEAVIKAEGASWNLVQALARLRGADVVSNLVQACDSTNRDAARTAALELEELAVEEPEARQALEGLRKHGNAEVRNTAIGALARLEKRGDGVVDLDEAARLLRRAVGGEWDAIRMVKADYVTGLAPRAGKEGSYFVLPCGLDRAGREKLQLFTGGREGTTVAGSNGTWTVIVHYAAYRREETGKILKTLGVEAGERVVNGLSVRIGTDKGWPELRGRYIGFRGDVLGRGYEAGETVKVEAVLSNHTNQEVRIAAVPAGAVIPPPMRLVVDGKEIEVGTGESAFDKERIVIPAGGTYTAWITLNTKKATGTAGRREKKLSATTELKSGDHTVRLVIVGRGGKGADEAFWWSGMLESNEVGLSIQGKEGR